MPENAENSGSWYDGNNVADGFQIGRVGSFTIV